LPLFPILLVLHIALAIGLLLPSLVLPFALRARGPGPSQSRFVTALIWLQSNGTLVIGGGLALTGLGMIATLSAQLLQQHWLLLALAIYAANLGLAFFVQRPGLARLLGMHPEQSDADRQRWSLWARRQRYVSYIMAGAVGLIAFLMSAKPQL
jgi:uncharacterized oligopeptide transporter (OPT) family protein